MFHSISFHSKLAGKGDTLHARQSWVSALRTVAALSPLWNNAWVGRNIKSVARTELFRAHVPEKLCVWLVTCRLLPMYRHGGYRHLDKAQLKCRTEVLEMKELGPPRNSGEQGCTSQLRRGVSSFV